MITVLFRHNHVNNSNPTSRMKTCEDMKHDAQHFCSVWLINGRTAWRMWDATCSN